MSPDSERSVGIPATLNTPASITVLVLPSALSAPVIVPNSVFPRERPNLYAAFQSHSVTAVTGGDDAQGGAHVVLEIEGEEVSGRATHTDVIVASALAYLQALSKFVTRRARRAQAAASASKTA